MFYPIERPQSRVHLTHILSSILYLQARKMRLSYVANPPEYKDEQDQAIVERVKQRRGERGLLELDLALLHAPPVADGW
jgi:hypothetical protein